MSYSRWGDSRWYTFGTVFSEPTKDGQAFDVDCCSQASYGEMCADFDGTLTRLIRASVEAGNCEPTPEEREELAGYMREFMADVDEDDAAGRDWSDKEWQRPYPL